MPRARRVSRRTSRHLPRPRTARPRRARSDIAAWSFPSVWPVYRAFTRSDERASAESTARRRLPAGSGSEVLGAEERLQEVRQVVIGAGDVMHVVRRAGHDQDEGEDGEGDDDEGADDSEAAAVGPDGGGDGGHFGGSLGGG